MCNGMEIMVVVSDFYDESDRTAIMPYTARSLMTAVYLRVSADQTTDRGGGEGGGLRKPSQRVDGERKSDGLRS